MPLHNSNTAAPKPAVKKSRAGGHVRCEEAEPTPAQKRRQERQEMRKAEKKRQARYLETPTKLGDDGFLHPEVLFTRRVSAYPAYDESRNKRRKIGHGPIRKKLARRSPWNKDARFKKPFLLPLPPVGASPRDQNPITAMGQFMGLPAEIREEVLRYILQWPHDIIVFDQWSRVFPRSRPRLNLSILYTCRVLREQGLRILFGENQFTYDLRDPAESHGHTNPVLDKVFGNSMIPINEYGHLIRHIKIKVHRSRLHFSEHRRRFNRALLKFLPGEGLAHAVNLHTLTLEVPAETNDQLEPELETLLTTNEPRIAPICRYLEEGSTLIDTILKLRIQWVHVLAWDKFGVCWQTKVDMRYYAKDQQMRLGYEAQDDENKRDVQAENVNNQGFPRAPAAASYRAKDVEAMEKRWDRQVRKAVGSLLNLAPRIGRLALGWYPAIGESKIWELVAIPADGAPECHAPNDELVSLPSDFREPPLGLRTRSGRGRAPPRPSNPNTERTLARSKTKANAMARTATRTSLNNANIFNAKDAALDEKLLDAQRGVQGNGMDRGDKNMLTEQWLESLPQ